MFDYFRDNAFNLGFKNSKACPESMSNLISLKIISSKKGFTQGFISCEILPDN